MISSKSRYNRDVLSQVSIHLYARILWARNLYVRTDVHFQIKRAQQQEEKDN